MRTATDRQRGSALLTVLWLTAALSAIGLAVAHNVRGETERAGTNVEDAKAYFLARGAVERTLLYREWGPDYLGPTVPVLNLDFPAGNVRVEIIPETSRLGLNNATDDELHRLLLALGEPEDRAMEITAAIIDWRTAITPDHPGLFEAFYLSRVPSFLPAHASFRENEELLLVRGVTPDLYYGTSLDGSRSGLRDCVSPSSMGGYVDVNTAHRETFIAVGISPQDADQLLRLRATHPILDYKELDSIRQSLGPAGTRLGLGSATMFTLRATARMKQPDGKLSDLRRTVAAKVKYFRPGNAQKKAPGYEIVRWYDRD